MLGAFAAARRPRRALAPRLRCLRSKETEAKGRSTGRTEQLSNREEDVMMFAFALALVAIVVLKSLDLVAARS